MAVKRKRGRKPAKPKMPPEHDWRTSDADELLKRKLRARDEVFKVTNLSPDHPVYSNFSVKSQSGGDYSVEIRDLERADFSCTCVDFRINGLGRCKHVEVVLHRLKNRLGKTFTEARAQGNPRFDITPDSETGTLRLLPGTGRKPVSLGRRFGKDGLLAEPVEDFLAWFKPPKFSDVRLSQEIAPWLENRARVAERHLLRRQYEQKVKSGEWPAHETNVPLYPYQREGMLHLAFTERALLADEMGLGKTIQAIAACALLHRLGKAERVLVVTPASLKSEWEEQIARFTGLPQQLVFGGRHHRLKLYDRESAPFFTIVNYEQMRYDLDHVNERLRPDIVVLDEAQRIKNWNTLTARTIKRLQSRYAFVLTGTPIENRIDELHSLMDFLDPSVLGPLFRFNREFYQLDDKGKPEGYRNLDKLHQRVKPYMIRRRKSDVERELPDRTDENRFVGMTDEQWLSYRSHEREVMLLIQIAERRPLRKEEQDKLQRELAMMRMICDTNYILDEEDRACPKLKELESIIEECVADDAKVIIFSEWQRMLQLVRELCDRMGVGYAWHTGSVPQKKRRGEINAFKTDPECRVFLSTDSGATGLNLQNASVVVNCDLPWNPAKLEQRIARAWRKHQTQTVTVINLVAEDSIEHNMLDTLATKQSVADGVLDRIGDVTEITLRRGRKEMVERVKNMLGKDAAAPTEARETKTAPKPEPCPTPTAKGAAGFAQRAREHFGNTVVHCEERFPDEGNHSVLLTVVERDANSHAPRLNGLAQDFIGKGNEDPLAPTKLEVIDRATYEAIQRLIDAGILARTDRAAIPLLDDFGEPPRPKPLTDEEKNAIAQRRQEAERNLKLARLLGEGGFELEARPPLLAAVHSTGRALALAHRLPEPTTIEASLGAPVDRHWDDIRPLQEFTASDSTAWRPVAATLRQQLSADA